jgi:hypothetical protein
MHIFSAFSGCSKRRRVFSAWAIGILMLALGPVIHAQTDSGSLRIQVVDVQGGVINGAAVKVTRQETNVNFEKCCSNVILSP